MLLQGSSDEFFQLESLHQLNDTKVLGITSGALYDVTSHHPSRNERLSRFIWADVRYRWDSSRVRFRSRITSFCQRTIRSHLRGDRRRHGRRFGSRGTNLCGRTTSSNRGRLRLLWSLSDGRRCRWNGIRTSLVVIKLCQDEIDKVYLLLVFDEGPGR